MKKFSFLVILMLFSSTIFGEEAFAPFSSKKANSAAQKFKKSYDGFYGKLDKSMGVSRGFAARQGKIEEVKKIQAALEGDFNQEFESSTAKIAVKSFKSSVIKLCQVLVYDLKLAMKSDLTSGNIEAAEEIQATIKKLEEVAPKTSKDSIKSFRVDAEKGWQLSDIEVVKGDKVTLYCTGTWTAYKKKSKKDADTNRLELKIGDSQSFKSGKKSEFNAKKTGKISFRMDHKLKGRRDSPYGSLSVKVTITPLDSFQKLHNLVLNINGKKTKKEKISKVKDEVAAESPDKGKMTEEEEISKVKDEVAAKKPDKGKLTKKDRKKLKRKKQEDDNNNNDFVPPPPE